MLIYPLVAMGAAAQYTANARSRASRRVPNAFPHREEQPMTTPRVISRDTTSTELDSDYKWGFTIDIGSDLDIPPRGSARTSSVLSPPRRKSPSGCWNGASKPTATGSGSSTRNRPGPTSTTPPSTIRTSITTPLLPTVTPPRASTRSTPRFSRPSKNWASPPPGA